MCTIEPNEVFVGINGDLWMVDSYHSCGCSGCGDQKKANPNNAKDISALKELKEELQTQIDSINKFLAEAG